MPSRPQLATRQPQLTHLFSSSLSLLGFRTQVPERPDIECLQLIVLALSPQHLGGPFGGPRGCKALRTIGNPECSECHERGVLGQDIWLLRIERVRCGMVCEFVFGAFLVHADSGKPGNG